MRNFKRGFTLILLVLVVAAACTYNVPTVPPSGGGDGGGTSPDGDTATVMRIIDGDTIDVRIGEVGYRVRYVGVNTPETDEVCYNEAKNANAALVDGKTVTLVRDVSNTDRFGRLLRYVYVDSTFVNATLVQQGYAETASYPPDTAQIPYFKTLEQEARTANRGCHPTGIFNDGDDER